MHYLSHDIARHNNEKIASIVKVLEAGEENKEEEQD
jgi:hypothetical protein